MTNRLELNWKLDGFVDEQCYYCSETAFTAETKPEPKVVLVGDLRTYVDTDIESGKIYYVAVGSVKNGVEKLSSISAISTDSDAYLDQVILLMHFDNSFKDEISQTNLEDIGIISYVPGEFNLGAQFTAATGTNYLRKPNTDGIFSFTGKFTIEFSFKHTESIAMYKNILICGQSTAPGGLAVWVNNGKIIVAQAYGPEFLTSNMIINQNSIYKIAITRDEFNVVRLFINGVLDKATTSSIDFSFSNSSYLHIGNFPNGGGGVGWIDELRITKGACRYTANYIVSSKPFPNP